MRHAFLDLGLDDLFFLGLGDGDDFLARFGAGTQKNVQRRIAAIIKDHVGTFGKLEGFIQIIPMFHQRLALDREHRRATGGNRGGGVILRGKDVARRPAHIGPQFVQRFDQHGGLDRHVQRSDDPRTGQRLGRAIFFAQRHQPRHFGFCDIQFLAAISGQCDILDDVIQRHTVSLFSKNGLTVHSIATRLPQSKVAYYAERSIFN